EGRRLVGDTGDLVGRLPVEFEIELSLGPTVLPSAESLQLAPPQAPLGGRSVVHGDTHARRLPLAATSFRHRLGRRDHTARDQSWAAFILAGEDEDRVALGDLL